MCAGFISKDTTCKVGHSLSTSKVCATETSCNFDWHGSLGCRKCRCFCSGYCNVSRFRYTPRKCVTDLVPRDCYRLNCETLKSAYTRKHASSTGKSVQLRSLLQSPPLPLPPLPPSPPSPPVAAVARVANSLRQSDIRRHLSTLIATYGSSFQWAAPAISQNVIIHILTSRNYTQYSHDTCRKEPGEVDEILDLASRSYKQYRLQCPRLLVICGYRQRHRCNYQKKVPKIRAFKEGTDTSTRIWK